MRQTDRENGIASMEDYMMGKGIYNGLDDVFYSTVEMYILIILIRVYIYYICSMLIMFSNLREYF